MKRKLFYCLLLAFFFIFHSPASFAYSRIISLKPNITEILFALGAGGQVVGVTNYCDRPEQARTLPKVADYIHVDVEKVLQLKPDLILGSTENSSQKEVYFLGGRGIRVELLPFSTLAEIMSSIEAMGGLLGRASEADHIVRTMRSEMEALKLKAKDLPKKKALFVVGADPLVVAGSGNFFNDSADALGVVNVAGQSRLRYPTYSSESLIQAAPEVILELTMGSESSVAQDERRRWWKRFSSLPAVQNGQIYFLNIERMRAVPSLPLFLREIFNILHDGKK